MSIPDAAIEAAAEAFARKRNPKHDTLDHSETLAVRAALEAAMPAIREALAQEIERLPINRRCASVHEYVTQVVRGGAA